MNSNSQVPINSTKSSIVVGAAAAVAMNASSTDTTPKAKMGSRRIFKTEFKVQVLDSYWNDNDCKGNQRATARKYGIHRRQIQKWLGNEKSLREQLKNQNTNNVVKPHQFHNVAYGNVAAAAVVAASAVKVSSTSPQTASKLMSLGQARHCVAPTSTTSLSPSSTSSSSSLSLSPSAVGTNTSTAITPIRPIPHQHPHTPVTIVPPTHFTQQHYHYHHSQLPHFMPPEQAPAKSSTSTSAPSVLAVDLTCRKRQNQSVADEDCTPEKVQKIKEENADDDDEEVDVDVEVDDGIEVQVAKPIKLFKPYLLDEEEENKDRSPIFPSSPSSLGAFSPAAACPKGSPVSVSGYESSSSTSTFGEYPTYNYSIDFKVNNYPTARSDNHSHVQRWLDHDANLRQGIAY
uniref:Brinker DNA-binding domain-containing protein n=1 Tax=Megaselia scalaris TaxID=36166 RepID=T1GEA6_MEGSC